ncbi:glycoside hydrolase family 76 protein [Verrucomicrobium sp. BvORR034]|uniref:glycoside hydrolase family 76 protein n=1 Tax=Verrucomicrobium sp. BvORR034 TaxID=1396418 RepID=UPI0006793037|nr:glycoside hydrolase family 76 protein [Verrucomicrobium sp. BvORR034]
MSAPSLPTSTRRTFLKQVTLAIGGLGLGEIHASTVPLVAQGLAELQKRYWCEPIQIWLDREGDQLRAHWEGKVNPPWWSAANAVELMLDHLAAGGGGGQDWLPLLEGMHDLNQDPIQRWPRVAEALRARGDWKDADEARLRQRMSRPSAHTGFRNEYLDDSAWWGVAWLKMHDRTRATKYLDTARGIQAHMAHNWRPDLAGGVIWCEEPGKQKPNAITNSLFLILTARLAQRTGEAAYRRQADDVFKWLQDQKLFDGTGVVDAPGHKGDWWSYNQGTYLGGLVEYAGLTGQVAPLDEAAQVAESVLTRAGFVDAGGIMVEKLGTSGWDGCLFKGILARYLRQTRDALVAKRLYSGVAAKIDRALEATAKVLSQPEMLQGGLLPAEWHPGAKNLERNFNTHLSALMALEAGRG